MASRLSVLFVCVHNADRTQMAAGFLTHLARDAIEVRSAGSAPAETINPAAVEAMAEVVIDLSQQSPKILTTDAVESSDVVITMGCEERLPGVSGISYRDWALPNPAGKSFEAVRPIRDEIKSRVQALITSSSPEAPPRRRLRDDTLGAVRLCQEDSGKSQMAAGLMQKLAGDTVRRAPRRNQARHRHQRAGGASARGQPRSRPVRGGCG